MAVHQFGIMDKAPEKGERYDRYEPEKFDMISISDELIESVMKELSAVKCFCHTPDIPWSGLVYAGITLIPPDSADNIAKIINDIPGLGDLKIMLLKARSENKFIIHYGL